ncbi:hypothetical protein GWI33_021858 [Rhynchophorus ferrugineus]|uniref:Uncharacterized protein n=1 Tax=Rhynchophorus ferrugineus TaxID=354439 RepID=A0A834HP99_RHYFE|nr:hypothetical protein GWI33_021858 [Rhynchophorus ferrugineus]
MTIASDKLSNPAKKSGPKSASRPIAIFNVSASQAALHIAYENIILRSDDAGGRDETGDRLLYHLRRLLAPSPSRNVNNINCFYLQTMQI